MACTSSEGATQLPEAPPERTCKFRLELNDSTMQFPTPQQAETPTPLLSTRREPQWQGQSPVLGASPRFPQSLSVFIEPEEGLVSTPAKGKGNRQSYHGLRPGTPPRLQKTRPVLKRFRSSSRSSSLNDEKVLFQSQLVRSQSTFKFLDNFVIEAEIGSSQHSKVFRVKHKSTHRQFALKRSAKKFSSKAHRDSCLHELSAVSSLPQHENIVSYYRAWQQNKHVYIQMALCEGGNLSGQIHRADGSGLCEQRIIEVLADLVQGLEFLHDHHVMHLDIKPDNIFLDAEGRCKIGDFGLAIQDEDTDWQEGDGAYLAPELLTSSPPTHAADIYSAGATVFECCTGERLPSDRERLAEMDLHVSEDLQALVKQMLQTDPSARPSAAAINRRIGELYAGHPDWSAPMERVASLSFGLHRSASGAGLRDVDAPELRRVEQTPLWAGSPLTVNLLPQDGVCSSPVVGPPKSLQKAHSLKNAPQQQHGVTASPVRQDGLCNSALPSSAAATPLMAASVVTPPASPFTSRGAFSTCEGGSNWASRAKEEPWRGVDDTAYCARKQPAREHWSRQALEFPLSSTPVDTPQFRQLSTPATSLEGAAVSRGGRCPTIAATRPFTAMRSPFQDASCQADDDSDDSSSWLTRRPFGQDLSPSKSLRYSKSLEMEDLQSTVRFLNMSS